MDFPEEFKREILRLREKVDTISGPRVKNERRRIVIGDTPPPPPPVTPTPQIVYVRNNSGEYRARFDVLGLDDPYFDPAVTEDLEAFKSRLYFDGVTPVSGAHEGRFGILQHSLPAGATGPAVVAGPVVCTVDVQDAAQQYCEIDDDNPVDLISDWGGSARILWKESGTGQVWAVVLLGAGDVGSGEYQGQVLTTVTQNSRGWDFPKSYAFPPL